MENNNQNLPNKSAGATEKDTKCDKSYFVMLVTMAFGVGLMCLCMSAKIIFEILELLGAL